MNTNSKCPCLIFFKIPEGDEMSWILFEINYERCDQLQNKELFFKITFLVFVILLVLRYSLVLVNNKKLITNNLFYFMLYLCALEIAPLAIILKLTI
jgi:hypothetical protein